MPQILIVLIGICSWVGYIVHNGHVDEPKITEKERIAYNHVGPKNDSGESNLISELNRMSPTELADWIAQHPVPVAEEPDGDKDVIHYDKATLDAITAIMNHDDTGSSSSTTSAQDTLNSGDANYTGSGDDSSVGSVQSETGAVVKVPAGYHWVKSYTRSNGTVVKGHTARNSGTKKKTTASKDLSKHTYTRSHDLAQRSTISKQNFPGATISGSDPTVIVGTVHIK
jgi:hypothetical protein